MLSFTRFVVILLLFEIVSANLGGALTGSSNGDSGGTTGSTNNDNEGKGGKGGKRGSSKGDSEGSSEGKGGKRGSSKGSSKGKGGKGGKRGSSKGYSKGSSEGKGGKRGSSKGYSKGSSKGKGGKGGSSKGGSKGSSKGSSKRSSKGKGSRNLVADNAMPITQNDPDYRAIARTCGDYDYQGALFVDTHLYAVAIPQEGATFAGCPFFVTHSIFASESHVAVKELVVFDNARVGEEFFGPEGTYVIGTFKLSKLLSAYEHTDPGAAGVYDALTNTCGNYMIELAQAIGAQIDTQVTSFIARRLVESNSKAVLDRVRRHINFSSLFGDRHLRVEDVSDKDLVERLVEAQASSLL